MPWFKVDDGFANSEPVMCVPRRYRASVIGLWTLSGTWCAKELTDGRVPAHMIDELAGTAAQAAWLVTSGLWAETSEGYVFIGWAKYQPMRVEVEAARHKESERKAKYRMSHRDKDGTQPSVPQVSQRVSGHPDPTRPDPTNKEKKNIVQAPLEQDFDSFWAVYPRKQGKADALKAYKAALKVVDAKTILAAVQAYNLLHIGEDKNFLKMPAGWLRGERWADDQIASVPLPPRKGSGMCSLHPEYPDPCDKCARGGNEF